jgi:hypothetical protein
MLVCLPDPGHDDHDTAIPAEQVTVVSGDLLAALRRLPGCHVVLPGQAIDGHGGCCQAGKRSSPDRGDVSRGQSGGHPCRSPEPLGKGACRETIPLTGELSPGQHSVRPVPSPGPGPGGRPANHLDQARIAHLLGHKTAKAISASNADAESK